MGSAFAKLTDKIGKIKNGGDPGEATFEPEKEGVSYSEIRDNLKSGDLALFYGGEDMAKIITYFERLKGRDENSARYDISPDAFSHVGLIVKSDMLDDDRLDPDKVYIWESTMSGSITDGVYNIDGEPFLGVQLRDFEEVVQGYDAPENSRIAIGRLKPEVMDRVWGDDPEGLRERFTEIFNTHNGIHYDANFFSLFASLYKFLRVLRGRVEEAAGTEEWLFCSELVALAYKKLGLFPDTVNPKNVVPMDFVGFDSDTTANGGIPVIVEEPFYIVADRDEEYLYSE